MAKLLIVICFIHFLADFVFQTDWMAKNKSKSWKALCLHITEYTGVLFGCLWSSAFLFAWLGRWELTSDLARQIAAFGVINGVAHFGIDAVTSRITSHYWQQQRAHAFFVVVGFDQFLHLALIIWTARLFGV